jgi:hypothetical protein
VGATAEKGRPKGGGISLGIVSNSHRSARKPDTDSKTKKEKKKNIQTSDIHKIKRETTF